MVNMYKLKLTKLQDEILRLLFIKAGKSLNHRQISKTLKCSQPAVMKALPYLEKQGLLAAKKDPDSGRWSVELNRDSKKALQLKRLDNLKQIYESGLSSILEKEFAGAAVILFGSYSRGDDIISSDIDIAVVGRKSREISIEKFEKFLERKINISFYNSFKDIHKSLRENILNGIVLSGGVFL